MSSEAEPRRSVRATKGQHTKSFDELEQTAPKRRQAKKSKKALEEDDGAPPEVIRCVCGATEQDEDSGEAWISCETCLIWQHNVCVGVSSFEDEIPDHYWCEKCRPENHKELLEGMARGEKPWEARRQEHDAMEAERKRRKGGRKPKAKRTSEGKEEGRKPSATPDIVGDPKDKKDQTAKQGKRKSREDSHDTDGKASKVRRVSQSETATSGPAYTPPEDLETVIANLPGTRVGPAKLLKRNMTLVLENLSKTGSIVLPENETADSLGDRLALQIERAVFDTHPVAKNQKDYSKQINSLQFNLKKNPELAQGLLAGSITPPMLAVMTSDQLASSELQRQTAEMRARAEKQSILYTSETGPRVRRTHKGEEIVDDDSFVPSEVHAPQPGGSRRGGARDVTVKRESVSELPMEAPSQGGQRSPSSPDFDISKVFSSVKSPTLGQQRRPSGPPLQTTGPGIDADVDRMLEDENDSPPYSPSEEIQDPDVVWRGSLAMSTIADFRATAKYIGGANFAAIGPWTKLIPKRMTVAGRITEQSAVEYLCGLRYSNLTDIVVVDLAPVSPVAKAEFTTLVEYFINKQRYGVIGDKAVGNVRDTYLVPVPAGEDGHPEFMLNLVDNYIPKSRTEPMLLAVFVYRHDPDKMNQAAKATPATPVPVPQLAGGNPFQRSNSIPGPTFSPATPSATGPPPLDGPVQSTTPVPVPQPPHLAKQQASAATPAAPTGPTPPPGATPSTATQTAMSDAQKYSAQQAGQAMAHEILGPLIKVSTVQFLLPQAYQMSRKEWEIVRAIYERDERARHDLVYLGKLLEEHGEESAKAQQSQQAAPAGP